MDDAFAPHEAREDYHTASRAPLTGLLFALPLFLLYHIGQWWLYTYAGVPWANAADVAVMWVLARLGAAGPVVGLGAVTLVFCGMQIAQRRPWRMPAASVWGWMLLESVLFAVPVFGLAWLVDWALAGGAPALWINAAGGTAPFFAQAAAPPAVAWTADGGLLDVGRATDYVLAIGAGVYEEFFFRVLVMGILAYLLKPMFSEAHKSRAWLVAAVIQAALFAAFHHYPFGHEAVTLPRVAFRTVSGVYFAYIYLERGFGVAAGAHAAYDVMLVALIGESAAP